MTAISPTPAATSPEQPSAVEGPAGLGGPPQSPVASLGQALFGGPGAVSPMMQSEILQKLGLDPKTQITEQNAGQIQQKVLQELQKKGVDVGQPPSLENARNKMIEALAGQPGMSREELANASLPDLMGRMEGLKQQQSMMQQRDGRFAQHFGPGAAGPASRVAGLQPPGSAVHMRRA